MKFALAALLGAVSAEKLFDAEVNLADGDLLACDLTKKTDAERCAEKTLCAMSSKSSWVAADGTAVLTPTVDAPVFVCQALKTDSTTEIEPKEFTVLIKDAAGATAATGKWAADSFTVYSGASALAASAAAALTVALAM